jgi:2-keto-4-pentenoate hydratase
MSSRINEAAQLLAAARRSRVQLQHFPRHLEPTDIAEAYSIQDINARELGVYGWKVGPARGGEQPRCAPLVGNTEYHSQHVFRCQADHNYEVELEVAVKLGESLPTIDGEYQAEDIEGAIASLHLSLELVGSRFRDRRTISPLLAIADNQSNEGVVLGEAIADWRNADLGTLSLQLLIGDRTVAEAKGGASLSDIVQQVTWLANHVASRGQGLVAGNVIMTGARIGPTPVLGGTMVTGQSNLFKPVVVMMSASEMINPITKEEK